MSANNRIYSFKLLLAENDKLRKENESASNLLAIIHRDGGHYQTKHGTVKSVKDAIKIWYDLLKENEQLKEEIKNDFI